MQRVRFYYLIKVQYLGYRLHGWQKQPNLKTVEGLITKTLRYVMPNAKYKVLGCRENLEEFLALFNLNLPQDIRVTDIEEVDANFNIIQHSKIKEYAYLFSFGSKIIHFAHHLWRIFSLILISNS